MLSQCSIRLQKGRYHRLHMGNDKLSRRYIIIRYHAVIKVNINWDPGRMCLISLRRIFRDLFRDFTFFMMGLHTSYPHLSIPSFILSSLSVCYHFAVPVVQLISFLLPRILSLQSVTSIWRLRLSTPSYYLSSRYILIIDQ